MSGELELRRLNPRDRCDAFCSGDDALVRYIRQFAKQHERRRLSANTIAVLEGAIVGFVTVLPGLVDSARVADRVKGLSRFPAPVLALARLASDRSVQRSPLRVGGRLLRDVVFPKALTLAADFGCVGIITDAKPASVGFYERFGFTKLTGTADASPTEHAAPTPMFLPLGTIEATLGDSRDT